MLSLSRKPELKYIKLRPNFNGSILVYLAGWPQVVSVLWPRLTRFGGHISPQFSSPRLTQFGGTRSLGFGALGFLDLVDPGRFGLVAPCCLSLVALGCLGLVPYVPSVWWP